MEPRNYGLILTPPEDDHYILGGVTGVTEKKVLMPDGHGWGAHKPAPETQNRNGLETYNCTNYGTHNALETLAFFHGFMDFPRDCSERYSGCLTGTTIGGNDPHKVIEIIRKEIGVVPEADLPFTAEITTWDEYYAKQSAQWLLPFGRRILNYLQIRHEWVFAFGSSYGVADKATRLKEALQYGTVCVSVFAWLERKGKYYKDVGQADNHWLQLLDYVDGKSWHVYDHYDDVEKDLEWKYDFNAAKVYYMDRIIPNPLTDFFDRVWASFSKLKLWKVS